MIVGFDGASGSDKTDVLLYYGEYIKLLYETDNRPKNVIIQGTNYETKHLLGTSDEAPEYYRY